MKTIHSNFKDGGLEKVEEKRSTFARIGSCSGNCPLKKIDSVNTRMGGGNVKT